MEAELAHRKTIRPHGNVQGPVEMMNGLEARSPKILLAVRLIARAAGFQP